MGTTLRPWGFARSPFFEMTAYDQVPSLQRSMLTAMDVLISEALLAGGADGLHKIVLAFTTYFEKTREHLKSK